MKCWGGGCQFIDKLRLLKHGPIATQIVSAEARVGAELPEGRNETIGLTLLLA